MERLHFFERLERENNYQHEYEKLEQLCAEEYATDPWGNSISINKWIGANFSYWKKRSNYCSYNEVREQLGFCTEKNHLGMYNVYPGVGLNEYILFCEMLINIICGLENKMEHHLKHVISVLIDTIKITVDKAGLEIKQLNGDFIIVTKNASAIEVAETNPKIADTVIEYNQYLLRGDLKRKKELLKIMADNLELERSKLEQICSRNTKDYFYLVNNMDIRHNNCNPNDASKYNEKFANLSDADKEKWYDLIYSQGLYLFISLEQQERNAMIDDFKTKTS